MSVKRINKKSRHLVKGDDSIHINNMNNEYRKHN